MDEKQVKLVEFFVDPELTDGRGIFVNTKQYIGKVKVTQDQADDLQRIISEYQETVRALHNPSSKIRIKNSSTIEAQFLANPRQYAHDVRFSKDFGLLDPWQWQYLPEPFKKYLQEQKKALYGN